MSNLQQDAKRVVIVSAYGRGHSLASRLNSLHIPVELLDVSENLGNWVLEESEGPFGIFQDESLDQQQYERLVQEDPPQEINNGFILWLSSGPLEFKGPLTKSRLSALGLHDAELDLTKKSKDFSSNWLKLMMANLNSNVMCSNYQSAKYNSPSDWNSPFWLRFPSRPGHQKSLDWCARQGVVVREKALVTDVSKKDRKNLSALEVRLGKSEKSQIMPFAQLVWCLTSQETQMMSDSLARGLYPRGGLEAEWSWSRYRIQIHEGPVRNQLPAHALWVQHIDEPWAHANYILMQRTSSPDLFDFWMRLPNSQRFNKAYLEMRGEDLLRELQKRLINLKVELRSYPLGHEFTYAQLGPARQPLYSPESLARFRAGDFQNVWFDSVEQRTALGWNAQFESERKILKSIQNWYEKLLLKENKSNSTSQGNEADL